MSQDTTAIPQDEHSTWPVIYPVYIDQTRSQRQGRRISKEMAVPTPTAAEVLRAIQSLNVPCHLEADKRHPATPRITGRVRVQFKDDAGDLLDEKIDCKDTLLLLIASQIAAYRRENAPKAPQQPAAKAAAKGKGKK